MVISIVMSWDMCMEASVPVAAAIAIGVRG
jgi:hypothetical protein